MEFSSHLRRYLPRRMRHYLRQNLDRGSQRAVAEAGKFWLRHRGRFQCLADLTPIAANSVHGQPTYLFSTHDVFIGAAVYTAGHYEEDHLRWILDFLGQPQRDRVVVEVGANIGTTTVPLLTRYGAATVEAFEPDPLNYDLLRCNLILNQVEGRALVRPYAISDAHHDVELELCSFNLGDHRVRVSGLQPPRQHLFGEDQRTSITVPARRLDEAVSSPPEAIGLVWVDAQGHEAHILEGAGNLLDGHIPWTIEYWPYALRRQGRLEELHRIIAKCFAQIVDVRASRAGGREVFVEADELERLDERLGDDYTDFILIPTHLAQLVHDVGTTRMSRSQSATPSMTIRG
jgi:FkbM family methyltransferase